MLREALGAPAMDDDGSAAICPITQEHMEDPVICGDGHSYERAAIEAWVWRCGCSSARQRAKCKHKVSSPVTNMPLPHKQLIANHALRNLIHERREAQGGSDHAQLDPSRLVVDAEVLGRGAWGVVRRGTLRDELLGGRVVRVAVKVLPDATVEQERAMLASELRLLALATARCTRVCRLLGTCTKEVGGQPRTCVVMKLYQRSLADLLAETAREAKAAGADGHAGLPLGRSLDLSAQMSRAVAELHEIPIVIGDLKPSNLLLDAYGQLVVADFGISMRLEGALTRFMPSSVKGTTSYMPPEAFDPEEFGGIGARAPRAVGPACSTRPAPARAALARRSRLSPSPSPQARARTCGPWRACSSSCSAALRPGRACATSR